MAIVGSVVEGEEVCRISSTELLLGLEMLAWMRYRIYAGIKLAPLMRGCARSFDDSLRNFIG